MNTLEILNQLDSELGELVLTADRNSHAKIQQAVDRYRRLAKEQQQKQELEPENEEV